MWIKVDTRQPLTILVVLLSVLAWLALWIWGQSPYSRFLSHHNLDAVRGDSALMLVFIAGWTIMVIAMMLPTSLPLFTIFQRLTHQRPNHIQLTGLLIGGYMAVWTLFGVVIYAGDWVLHQVVDRNIWLQTNAWVLGAITLILAGLYQFSQLKYQCLDKCRSPLSFVMEHWRGKDEWRQALRLGIHHGLFCVGCCWPLMLLMFAVAAGNLGWMLVLGAIMAVEKNMTWGKRISRPLGIMLLVWGVTLMLLGAPAMDNTHVH